MYEYMHAITPEIQLKPEKVAVSAGISAYLYRVVQKRYPCFNFAITSVNVHRF